MGVVRGLGSGCSHAAAWGSDISLTALVVNPGCVAVVKSWLGHNSTLGTLPSREDVELMFRGNLEAFSIV